MNIWLANDLEFRHWLTCNTAREFEGYREADEELESGQNEEGTDNSIYPPIRKVNF